MSDAAGVDAASLVGKKVKCPGSTFNTPGKFYDGLVTGTPKTSRANKRCYVTFKDDPTEYWSMEEYREIDHSLYTNLLCQFPKKKSGQQGKHGTVPNEPGINTDLSETDVTDTEAYTTEAYTTEAPSQSEAEPEGDLKDEGKPVPLGQRASGIVVSHGAQYGVPVGLTLLVLILAGAVWFFRQLWLSEQRLTWSSLPNSDISAVPPKFQQYVKE